MKDRELVLHGYETGRIVRLRGGEYVDVHRPLDDYERWRLSQATDRVSVTLPSPSLLRRRNSTEE